MRSFVLGVLLFPAVLLTATETSPKSHIEYRTEGLAAFRRKDYAAAREAFAAALKLRPDSPRYLYNLAALSALSRDETHALAYLRQLAALGVYLPAEKDESFGSLQGKTEFTAALRALADNRTPRGHADVFAEFSNRTGILEGIAYRNRTGDLFLGDVHNRCIWKRDQRGQLTRFSATDDKLLGIFGLAVDEAHNTLWAAMTALPEMSGFDPTMKGRAALAEFDLSTSELRRVIPVPNDGRDHHAGDLTVAPDGTVYLTDSVAPVIWSYTPGADKIEKFVESRDFVSLQGIICANRTLLISDYANGLFAIDVGSRRIRSLDPPRDTTMLGIDGIVAIPGGIIATQNGIEPQRVIHVTLTPKLDAIKAVEVLASGQPNFTDLTLIALANDRPIAIAGSGWDGFDPAKSTHPPAHAVRIFQMTLP